MRAKNLKYLRTKYKQKQTDLSAKVNIAQNTLSEYENGRRPIPDDVAQTLAYHYRVSVFDFTNTDLSRYGTVLIAENGFLPDRKILLQALDSFFPVVPPAEDCEDSFFHSGYKKIVSLQQRVMNAQKIGSEELVECLKLFAHSVDTAPSEGAVANCISIIFFLCATYCNVMTEMEGVFVDSILKEKPLSYLEAQKVILRDVPNEKTLFDLEEDRLGFVRKLDESVMTCIGRLKVSSNSDYRELADYYLACMYVVGFADNEFDLETNQRIGFELLGRLYQLDNQYAKKLITPWLDHIANSDI